MNRICFFISFITLIVLFACSNEHSKKEDPYPKFTFPIISNSSKVTTNWENDIYGKSTSYFIQELRSPETIFNFYNNEFEKKGFKTNFTNSFPNLNFSQQQKYFQEGNWQAPPAIYAMAWKNQDNSMLIKVSLIYQKNETVQIICFIHPYSDQTEFLKFMQILNEEGNEEELSIILNKYRKKNGNFDLAKAKKEKTPNIILSKLIKIVENDTLQLRSNYLKYSAKN
jgi:hypothetical protein